MCVSSDEKCYFSGKFCILIKANCTQKGQLSEENKMIKTEEIEQNILRSLSIFARESIYLLVLVWKSFRFLSKTMRRISGFSFTILN